MLADLIYFGENRKHVSFMCLLSFEFFTKPLLVCFPFSCCSSMSLCDFRIQSSMLENLVSFDRNLV